MTATFTLSEIGNIRTEAAIYAEGTRYTAEESDGLSDLAVQEGEQP